MKDTGTGKRAWVDVVEARVRMARGGLRTGDVATYLGVSYVSVHRWLSGERPVPASRVEALVEVLGPRRGLFRRG